MNWKWTWVNFVASLFINRLRFLSDTGLCNLHAWVTEMQPGSDNYPAARYIDFYVSALLSALILSLFHLRPVHYGVLLPSMPAVAHVLQEDGHLVPLVDNVPPQSLTRKVSLISVQYLMQLILQLAHRSQLVQKALLYLALFVTCVGVTYLYAAGLTFLFQSTPSWQVVAVAISILMFLFVLGILKLFSVLPSIT